MQNSGLRIRNNPNAETPRAPGGAAMAASTSAAKPASMKAVESEGSEAMHSEILRFRNCGGTNMISVQQVW